MTKPPASEQRLRTALKEACDEFEYALSYKSEYLVKKHCDRDTLARLRGELLDRPDVDLHPASPAPPEPSGAPTEYSDKDSEEFG